MKKALIVSLHFSPGHSSHMVAWKNALEEIGYEVEFLLHPQYQEMSSNTLSASFSEDSLNDVYEVVVIQNPSLRNKRFASSIKKTCDSRIVYIYHEPWDSIRNNLKEGPKVFTKKALSFFHHRSFLPLVDIVVLPSEHAKSLYLKRYRKMKERGSVIPLLFTDEITDESFDTENKEFFSYIGHAIRGHAFDMYIKFIHYCLERESDMKFMIATRTDISYIFEKEEWLMKSISNGRLLIRHGRPLSNEEINESFKRSFAVWNVYRRSTQSGVLPKAFMFGTPVLASNVGSFLEFVEPSVNGEIVDNEFDFEEIYERLINMKQNIHNYSQNARESFLNCFYYKANIMKLASVIDAD